MRVQAATREKARAGDGTSEEEEGDGEEWVPGFQGTGRTVLRRHGFLPFTA